MKLLPSLAARFLRTSLMGAVRYIEKPSQLEEFLTTVGTAAKGIFAESLKAHGRQEPLRRNGRLTWRQPPI